MALHPKENRFRSVPIAEGLTRSDDPTSVGGPDPVEFICEELCNLRGKRVQIASIVEDAIPYVRTLYPEAVPHGSLGHWYWIIGARNKGEIVAEAWPAVSNGNRPSDRELTGWWLRIKRR